jgi:hypothetical protein
MLLSFPSILQLFVPLRLLSELILEKPEIRLCCIYCERIIITFLYMELTKLLCVMQQGACLEWEQDILSCS